MRVTRLVWPRVLPGVFLAAAFLSGALLLAGSPAPGAEPGENPSSEGAAETRVAAPPDLASIVLRAGRTGERLARLQGLMGDLRAQPLEEGALSKRRVRANELSAAFENLRQSKTAGYIQHADVAAAVRAEWAVLERLGETLAGSLRRIDGLRAEWLKDKQEWADLEASLAVVAESKAVQPTVDEAKRNVEQALALLAEAVGPTLSLQRDLGELQGLLQKTAAAAEAALRALREDLFRRSGFPILSGEFVAQFGPELISDLRQSTAQVVWPGRRFFQVYGWVILLQLGTAAVLGRALHRRREAFASSDRWQFLGKRPWAVAVFVGFSVFSPLYSAAAFPSWRLALWSVTAISAARLLGGLVSRPWQRRILYLLAVLFLVTQGLRVYGIPLPLFRLYVLTIGLLGAPFCLWRANVNRLRGASRYYVAALQAGSVITGLTFLAQLAGYAAFATHLLTASIQTTFIVLLGWTLALLARGALVFGLGPSSVLYRYTPLRRNAPHLVRRLGIVVDLAVVAAAVGLILEVWRVYPSPLDALDSVLALGFNLGGVRVSVGLVLGVCAILYGAALLSGLIQELLMAELYPRSHVEWGVRVSMNRLVHYGIIAIGFFIAVGTMGVDFQNITILAGAFSIGIGFGLQNIVNNFVSGLILLFERPIKVGDVVMLDGEWAIIKKLGLRATIVQTLSRSDIIVPNSELVSNKVTNWTLYDRLMRLSVPVGVVYGSNVELTMRTLGEVAKDHPEVVDDPEPNVVFKSFGDSSLDFDLRVWVDAERFIQISSDLHREIDRRFRIAGLEIAFPQRDLHLRTVDERARRALGAVAAAGATGRSPSDPAPDGPQEEQV